MYWPSGTSWPVLWRPLPLTYLYKYNKTAVYIFRSRRSPWLRDLRHGSAVSRLLELRVRIPTGAWTSVSCDLCMLTDRVLCDGPISNPEAPIECGVPECDRESSIIRDPGTMGFCGTMGAGGGSLQAMDHTVNRTKRHRTFIWTAAEFSAMLPDGMCLLFCGQ